MKEYAYRVKMVESVKLKKQTWKLVFISKYYVRINQSQEGLQLIFDYAWGTNVSGVKQIAHQWEFILIDNSNWVQDKNILIRK